MTNFVCTTIAPILAEVDRLLGRALLLFWMTSLREQLQRESGSLR
jgi:hypothetical protein